jgi:hypothetical protein
MTQETITHKCRSSESVNIVKNGRNAQGQQQYWRKGCNNRAAPHLKPRWSADEKEEIIAARHERRSMGGMSRMFNVSRQALSSWLEKKTLRIQAWKRHRFSFRNMMSWWSWMRCGHLS